MNSKVNILLSTYNGEKYFKEQVKSIMRQKDTDVYLSIRDDGSTEPTYVKSTLEELCFPADRYEIFEENNIGVVDSFFALIKRAQEDFDFYALCDQDDVWEPKKLSVAIEHLNQNNKSVYASTLKIVDSSLNLKFKTLKPRFINFENALLENIFTGCTLVFNRGFLKLCKSHLPDTRYVTMHDSWLYMLATYYNCFFFDNNSYINYRQHGNNEVGMASSIKTIFKKVKKFTYIKSDNKFYNQAIQLQIVLKHYNDQPKLQINDNYKKLQKYIDARQSLLKRTKLALMSKRNNSFEKPFYVILFILGRY